MFPLKISNIKKSNKIIAAIRQLQDAAAVRFEAIR